VKSTSEAVALTLPLSDLVAYTVNPVLRVLSLTKAIKSLDQYQEGM
ncbi:uncharacterized protein METZ01_LOCUS323075, partial [marine metagenome]